MGLFTKLFGKATQSTKFKTNIVDMFNPTFKALGDITENNVVQEAVNSITKHSGKMKLQHRTVKEKQRTDGRAALNEILQFTPNPIENGADFLEKAMFHYLMDNHCFIFLKFKPSNAMTGKELLDSMWVLNPYTMTVLAKESGDVYLKFRINNELEEVVTSIENVVVIKRMVGKDDFFGATSAAITGILSLINTNYQGIENAIKSSAVIRFIIENATVLNPDKRAAKAEQFRNEFLSATKNGGVIYSDAANKITPISNNSFVANFKQMEMFDKKVYNYFGTNENIVAGDYTDAQWNSFYESTLEPFIHKLEVEFTKKLFTQNERAYGNKIEVVVNKLQSMSLTTRLNVLKETNQLGILTINEARELLYFPAVEDGDKRLVSLNYVNAEKQDKYQVGEDDKDEEKPDEDNPDDDGKEDNPDETK